MSQKNAGKNVAIDLLRGLSIVYIVGFWHLFDLTSQFPGYKNAVTHNLTVIILSVFVFLSGYLLAICWLALMGRRRSRLWGVSLRQGF